MKIFLIRHGETKGNQERRYVGRTDESLTEKGRGKLKQLSLPPVDQVYISPLRRCKETAEILYPKIRKEIVEDFRECDFGEFEYKNFDELKESLLYQEWVASGGNSVFPGGEEPEKFRKRCVEAAKERIKGALERQASSISLVVHGGTIMSILDTYSWPNQGFYCWQIGNGSGYFCEIEDCMWKSGKYRIVVKEPIR